MKRVLLISPLPGVDPPNGDVTYTETLLRHPPEGVSYETYADALAAGRLREVGRRADFQRAEGRARVSALSKVVQERGINHLRRRGILFREPFRHFIVTPGVYDLVHCHAFSASFAGLEAPLVMSNAITIEELYLQARRWSQAHVRLASWVDAALARMQRVQHTSHGMPAAHAVVCFTEALAEELLGRNSTTPGRIHVAPCFVESRPRPEGSLRPRRIGFVASDFDAKGGRTVLEAFRIVRQARADAELIIIGSEPRLSQAEQGARGVTWLPKVARAELLDHYMPGFDVMAYPTEFDGLPLTLLEAMSLGVPVATSDYLAMPEIVGHGAAGSVTPRGDARALASALLTLLEGDINVAARQRTYEWFLAHYAPGPATQKLRDAYNSAEAVWATTATKNPRSRLTRRLTMRRPQRCPPGKARG